MHNKGEFLHKLQANTGLAERDEAEKVTKSVLTTLRKRITPEEAKHVEAQLPEGLKELWHGSVLSGLAHKLTGPDSLSAHEFMEHVAKELNVSDERAAELTRHVFHLLKEQITEGQAKHVEDQLPKNLKVVWLEA